ncbi:MlaD family protein [Oceanisphaera pacifica]|uniref:MCE family protein n=1 Tax=Oceanisphaera pacifica TaxID=2818389 RepID=A0ABS3NJM1_9GAMM|nr:MlaD family protein [Oceanisphaera pacifica]MBO1520411.1 MCE family protein [Oceanisphaera pacifica]
METRAHHVLIGLFTLAVAGGILLFSLWLVKASDQQDSQLYDIVFREAVTGLSIGSRVEYSGIRVGVVTQLSLDKHDPRQVWARVRLTEQAPIKVDTQARLSLALITGIASIQLSQGSPNSPLLESKNGDIPQIVATPSPIARLRLNSEDLMQSVTLLVDNANRLFSKENSEHFSQVLANLETTTALVSEQKAELRQGVQDIVAASQQMKMAMTRANRLISDVEHQLDHKGERLWSHADNALASLSRSSAQIEHLLKDNQQALSSGLQGMGELQPMMRELRSTLTRLGELSRRLEQDPVNFLMGSDNITEFQP